ncbi:MAG: hypothetical protein ACFFC7_12510 [Candidatus Hermodarchaeota archaeon]
MVYQGIVKDPVHLAEANPARRYLHAALLLWSRWAYFLTRLNPATSPIQSQTVYPQFIVCP